jgi:hypothetical protein
VIISRGLSGPAGRCCAAGAATLFISVFGILVEPARSRAHEDAVPAAHLREKPETVERAVPDTKAPRKGLVRLEGRSFADGGGPYLALGTSLFWALWGYQHDRVRLERHLDFLSKRGVDYIRVFGIIGRRWADRVIDPRDDGWDQHLAGLLDLAHGTYGLRVELTIWQDTHLTPTRADRARVIDRVAAVVKSRPQSIQYFEIANEGYTDLERFPAGWPDEAQELATKLRTLTPHAVAVTSPASLEPGEIARWYGQTTANILTAHLPRDVAGDGIAGQWGYVRQTWDPWLASPLPWTNDEGKGPQSSIAEDADPLRLVMYAGLTWLSGGAGFVLHTGAGVGGGDTASVGRGRVGNIWDVANIEQTLAGIAALRRVLPADLPNWRRHNSNERFPDYPWETEPISGLIEQNRLVRAYAATSEDGRIVAMPIGVSAAVPFRPRFPMHMAVHDPMTGTRLESFDGPFTLYPRQAAVMIGRRR